MNNPQKNANIFGLTCVILNVLSHLLILSSKGFLYGEKVIL